MRKTYYKISGKINLHKIEKPKILFNVLQFKESCKKIIDDDLIKIKMVIIVNRVIKLT